MLPDLADSRRARATIDLRERSTVHATRVCWSRITSGVLLDVIGAGRAFADPHQLYQRTRQVLMAILDPTAASYRDTGFREEEVDEKLTTHAVYHVMDADPSQIAVIEDIKQGRNLVVEGPPGKSQTITNVIAELLAAGKSVLFVSEKMAALEVVKSRLDRVGLGDFCLELHSRKANKREVLKELERTLSAPAPQMHWRESTFAQVESLKADLNAYAKALREPFGQMQRSSFALFCIQETARRHFAEVGRPMPRVAFANPAACDPHAWSTAVDHLCNLAEALHSSCR